MHIVRPLILGLLLSACVHAAEVQQQALPQQSVQNPVIDAEGFLESAHAALALRQSHRVGEREFLRLMREPGTVVLDARSREKFDELHIEGAINLSFPDIALLHCVRLRGGATTLAEMLMFLHRHDLAAERPAAGALQREGSRRSSSLVQ